ncbi:MAG TPA: PHP domain-containing protein [Verrucomicrobia bacterium]|nr:PHP domain-containing protein [Verrucomicrobiota bacterium]HOB32627.1 PHP domain-containing protein [Verrucomicrobiota bacterium]HOP97561.1 PHP domain-containing protein [Verrucomicrobiota bacterium]
MVADLHLHSNFSDGTYTPEEIVSHAARHRLSAIALTDHDTVEGCDAAARACHAAGIEFIPGTELTAQHGDDEIHILAYFCDTRNEKLLAEIGKFQAVRQNRIREMVARLNRMDVPLRVESVFELANCRSPGRPHVARALVKAGLVGSLDEAFERYLKKSRGAWVPKAKMSALAAIELIHQAQGLAVMAHPGLNRTDQVIPKLVEAGLDGIECFHSKHSAATARHYLDIAARFGLLVTGGSDCHGVSKGKPLIGTVRLPYEHVTRLRDKAERLRVSTSSGPCIPRT